MSFVKLLAAVPESKQEILRKQFGFDDTILKAISDTDPTDRGEYAVWIARQVKNKKIRLPEDSEKIKAQLETFTLLKRSPNFTESKDLNSYTPEKLYEVTKPEAAEQNVSQNEQDRIALETGSSIILEKGDWKVFKVISWRAANLLGSNTNWCTAHEYHSKNYLMQAPLYVFQYRGKAQAQCHFRSRQFANIQDRMFLKSQQGRYYWIPTELTMENPNEFKQVFREFLQKIGSKLQVYDDGTEGEAIVTGKQIGRAHV